MKKALLFSMLSMFLLTGCNTPVEPEPTPEPEPTDTYDDFHKSETFDAKMRGGTTFTMDLHFKSDDFKANNKEFNKNLATNSLALSVASRNVEVANKFLTDFECDDIFTSESYDSTKNENLIAYTFANRRLDDSYLVMLSVRGFEYDNQEIVDDFNIGESGEHLGFKNASEAVIADFKAYLNNEKFADKELTVWLTGYSRAGAVAGLVAKDVIDNVTDYKTTKDKVFTYTFESPLYANGENVGYESIFNVINDNDVIIMIPPAEYGFARYGVDVEIAGDKDVVSMLNGDYDFMFLDPFREQVAEFNLANNPPFDFSDVEGGITTPKEYYQKLIDYLKEMLKDVTEELSIETREDFDAFFNKMAVVISNFLSEDNLEKIKNYESVIDMDELKEDAAPIAFYIIAVPQLLKGDEIYNFLKKYADKLELTYNDEELHTFSTILQNLLVKMFSDTDESGNKTIMLHIGTVVGNFNFIYAMHCPESIYSLLKRY